MNKQYWSRRIRTPSPISPASSPRTGAIVKAQHQRESLSTVSQRCRKPSKMWRISDLRLYPDPDCLQLRTRTGKPTHHIAAWNMCSCGNGSDEILAFCLPCVYGCRPILQSFPGYHLQLLPGVCGAISEQHENCCRVPASPISPIPLDALCKNDGTVVLTNPNAPTGIAVSLHAIERHPEGRIPAMW